MPVYLETACVTEVAREAVAQMSRLAEQKRVGLRCAGEDVVAEVDRGLFERVIKNLLSNAIKACEAGDGIEVRVLEAEGRARVEVEDTGRGIDAEYLEKIFEKFTQSGKGIDGGVSASSGVGLAFCKLAVQEHGGEIGVRSEPGKGSVFWLEIPTGSGARA